VAAAVGLDPQRGDTIVVDTMAFDESLAEAADEARSSAASSESTEKMMGYVQTGVGVLMLLLVAFFLRKGLKGPKVQPVELPPDGPGSLAAALAAAQPAGGLMPGPISLDGSGEHLPVATPVPAMAGVGATSAAGAAANLPALAGSHDDMLQLIDQQPEEVAVLLRNWLADRRG
jgi:flagellar M-ring protein FliF